MSENSDTEENLAPVPEADSGPKDAAADQEEAGDGGDDLAAKVADLEDRLLRTQAEMANAAKRSQEEGKRLVLHASEHFARHFLEVADNLERALASRSETDAKALIEGVALTLNGLQSTFAALGIETIEPNVGDKPDPHQHQTIMLDPTGEIAAGCIVRTVQKGYRMNQRLIRAAKIIVAQQPEEKEATKAEPAAADQTEESKS